jgi:nitroimidazol reductase NimA-like FMN-containing flavoprotein (pyridoxamine 5'-phosphate oxidase superfamily)
MVAIPDKVLKMIRNEQVIVVGTTNKKICNISPRTAFHLDQNGSIYWIELFKHKSLRNLQKNPWCTVASFNKKSLTGYQLKGKATLVSDRQEKRHIVAEITDRLTRLHKQRIIAKLKNRKPTIIKFDAKIIFSLKPNEFADTPILIDANTESLRASDMQW